MKGRGPQYWDGRMVHNPHITRQGKKWVLYYIGSTHPFTEVKHSENITMQDPRVIVAGFGGGCARSENEDKWDIRRIRYAAIFGK